MISSLSYFIIPNMARNENQPAGPEVGPKDIEAFDTKIQSLLQPQIDVGGDTIHSARFKKGDYKGFVTYVQPEGRHLIPDLTTNHAFVTLDVPLEKLPNGNSLIRRKKIASGLTLTEMGIQKSLDYNERTFEVDVEGNVIQPEIKDRPGKSWDELEGELSSGYLSQETIAAADEVILEVSEFIAHPIQRDEYEEVMNVVRGLTSDDLI